MNIQQLRQTCIADFKAFVHVNVQMLGHKPHPLQYLMADFLQALRPEWDRREQVLLGFRYLTKTFLLRQLAKWRWLRNPNCQIIVHSSTRSLAKRFAKSILVSLRADPMTAFLAPKGETAEYEWNLNGITPEQGYSLQCAGIKTSLTGSRADLYIFDDPEPDDEPDALHDRILKSFEEAKFILHPMDRWINHFNRFNISGMPTPEHTQLVVVGQPHTETTVYIPPHPGLVHDDDVGHPLAEAAFLRIPAVDQRGQWMWPEKYYNEQAKRILKPSEVAKGFTRRTWRLQMLLKTSPITSGEILNLSCIEKRHVSVKAPGLLVDPADGGKAEWGVVVGGLVGSKVHLLDIIGFHGEAYEGDEEDDTIGESAWAYVFDVADELGVKWILLEKNLKAARTACKRFLSKRKLRMSVYEYPATGSKHRRIIESLEQPVNNGLLSAEPHIFHDPKTVNQLTSLSYARLPEPNDRIDALAGFVDHFIEMPGMAVIKDPNARIGPRVHRYMSSQYKKLRISQSPYERMRRRERVGMRT